MKRSFHENKNSRNNFFSRFVEISCRSSLFSIAKINRTTRRSITINRSNESNCNGLLSFRYSRRKISILILDFKNVGDELHRWILEIIHLLCQIDPTFARSNVIDHPMVLNAISMLSKHPISVLNLLIDLVLTNELFPVQTNSNIYWIGAISQWISSRRLGQLSNEEFLKRIFEFIEHHPENEELLSISIKFLLSYNLRFNYPEENPLLLTLGNNLEQLSSRTLIEQLIFLFNRNSTTLSSCRWLSKRFSIILDDPIGHSSIIKFLSDLHGETGDLLTDFNRRLLVEIIDRELIDRTCADPMLTSYLSLLELILRHRSIRSIFSTRVEELKECLQALLSAENCSEENRFIIKEIFRQHF